MAPGPTWRMFQICENAPSVEDGFVFVSVHVRVHVRERLLVHLSDYPDNLLIDALVNDVPRKTETQTDEEEGEESEDSVIY